MIKFAEICDNTIRGQSSNHIIIDDYTLPEEKKALINLIEWYRDDYHRKDFGHDKMIKEIEEAKDLEPYYRIVDSWLD